MTDWMEYQMIINVLLFGMLLGVVVMILKLWSIVKSIWTFVKEHCK